MGTRQELGLLVLVLLLALPAAWGTIAGQRPSADMPAPCQRPVEVAGAVSAPGLVCLSADERMAGLPPGCRPPEPLRPGTRLVVERKGESDCLIRIEPMTGSHLLLVDLAIDPNRATAADLQAIPGIGPVLSERIVANRQEHGPFHTPDDLIRVRGIGPKTFERIKPFVRIVKGNTGGR